MAVRTKTERARKEPDYPAGRLQQSVSLMLDIEPVHYPDWLRDEARARKLTLSGLITEMIDAERARRSGWRH